LSFWAATAELKGAGLIEIMSNNNSAGNRRGDPGSRAHRVGR
jgi:hypothetical protein